MPEIDRIPDALLLAAVKRAVLHRDVQEGVPHWVVADHLALTRGAGTTRRLRPQLEALDAVGLLEHSRLYGRTVWKVTPKGPQTREPVPRATRVTAASRVARGARARRRAPR